MEGSQSWPFWPDQEQHATGFRPLALQAPNEFSLAYSQIRVQLDRRDANQKRHYVWHKIAISGAIRSAFRGTSLVSGFDRSFADDVFRSVQSPPSVSR